MKCPDQIAAMLRVLCFVAATSSFVTSAHGITWNRAQGQGAEWFRTDEGKHVVDNVLLYQFPSGGWPKNIDMARPLSDADKKRLAKRRRDETQIDDPAGRPYVQ